MNPTAAEFRELAVSSLTLWRTMSFTGEFGQRAPVHAVITRPNQLMVRNASGTIAHRASGTPRTSRWDDTVPFYENYHWVAMLQPLELAGTNLHDPTDIDDEAVIYSDVREVDHHGRPAWEALAQSTSRFSPRCSCCALLLGEFDYDDQLWVPGEPTTVRLDVNTGICVAVTAPDSYWLDVTILSAA